MENLNVTSEKIQDSKIENSENQKVKNSPKVKKEKKERSTDAINFDKVKVDISKGKKELITKERSVLSKKSLYKGTDSLGEEESKKFRGKIRRSLHRFVNEILGKDRTNEEREKSVKAFLKFYKENWKIQDFKIENFSQSKNSTDLKDYIDLLRYVQSILK
jgi:hypothetical protein